MKKDVIIAIVVGFGIGAVAAFAAVNIPSLIKKGTAIPTGTIDSANISISPSVQISSIPVTLEVTTPADETIMTSKNLKISGKTQNNNLVYAISDSDSAVTEADKNGAFGLTLTLSEGGNNIYLTSQNENGDEETKIMTVYFAPEKL